MRLVIICSSTAVFLQTLHTYDKSTYFCKEQKRIPKDSFSKWCFEYDVLFSLNTAKCENLNHTVYNQCKSHSLCSYTSPCQYKPHQDERHFLLPEMVTPTYRRKLLLCWTSLQVETGCYYVIMHSGWNIFLLSHPHHSLAATHPLFVITILQLNKSVSRLEIGDDWPCDTVLRAKVKMKPNV